MKRSGYTSQTTPDNRGTRICLGWPWLLCLLVVAALSGSLQPALAATRVVFSFGKVEVLRVGASEWQFIRSDMLLDGSDLVRMPPVSLLRLGEEDDERLRLLTGVHEALVEDLLAAAENVPNGAAPAGTGEAEATDLLPAGDPDQSRSGSPVPVRMDAADRATWRANEWATHPRIREAAAEAQSQHTGVSRGHPHLAALSRLHGAMCRILLPGEPLRQAFADDSAAPVIVLAALVGAAGLPSERVALSDGTPILLVRADESASSGAALTANRDLLHVAHDGTVYLPLHPTSRTMSFVEAWYRGGAAMTAALTEDLGLLP